MTAFAFATSVIKKLVDAGHIAYIAGGWVRDFLMQHPSDDIDIATNASVEEIQKLFPKTIPVGVAFGIVIVVEGGHQFEVATFRKDRGYVDGRRPTGIDPAAPEEDATRRDFTINGMFYDPLKKNLIDFVKGQEDLKKGIIRAIGNPHERFAEDKLRMMRAVRYSTRFNFPIESETLTAIYAHAESLCPAVAMERIWQEFKKMSLFAHFDAGLATLHQLHLLPTIFPALKNTPIEEIEKRLAPCAHFPQDAPALAELLQLFPLLSLEEVLQLCDYLKLSKKERDFALFLQHAKNLLQMPADWQKGLELFEWAQFYAHPSIEMALHIVAAHLPDKERAPFLEEHQRRKKQLHAAIQRIQLKKPIVNAEHLMQAGIAPGKKMGKLLEEAERIAVNQNLDNREMIIKALQNSPFWMHD